MRVASMSHRTRRIAKAAVVSLLAAGTIALGFASPASAGGISASHYNCYTQWWNTAWAQKCYLGGNSVVGWFQSGVACSWESDKSFMRYRLAHSTTIYSGDDCAHSASNGWIHYLRY